MRVVFNPITGSFDMINGGDVVGPSSSTDNAIARFDGITGKLIQDSSVLISDTGELTIAPTGNAVLMVSISGTNTSNTANTRGLKVTAIFTGSGAGQAGIEASPEHRPSASVTAAYGFINIAKGNPDTGVTITNLYAGFNRIDTGNLAGVVSNAQGLFISRSTLGSLIPGSMRGIQIQDIFPTASSSGTTNIIGLQIDGQHHGSSINEGIRVTMPTAGTGMGNVTNSNGLDFPAGTFTLGDQTATTTNQTAIFIGTHTYQSTTNTRTLTRAAGLYIENAPVASTNVTITNGPYAIWVDAGDSRMDGALLLTDTGGTSAGGITFGVDANIYRIAANILATDDSLRVAGYLRVGSTAAPTNTTAGDLTASRISIGNGSFLTNNILKVDGANIANGGTGIVTIQSTDSASTDIGGSLALGGWVNGTGTYEGFATISGRKENVTAGNTRGYMQFSTNGSERMRISSNGFVGINVTNPNQARLHIGGNLTNITAWLLNGTILRLDAATYTDTGTAGTRATGVVVSAGQPTFASTNAITVTDAANVYIAGAVLAGTNMTLTNSYALWVDAGITRLDGNVSLGSHIYYQSEVDNGNSGAADTVDWTAGNVQKSTLTGNCAFTFTSPTGPSHLTLKLIQDATGSRDPSWPATVKWAGGVEPTWTTTAGAIDIVTFYYDGTNYYGAANKAFA